MKTASKMSLGVILKRCIQDVSYVSISKTKSESSTGWTV